MTLSLEELLGMPADKVLQEEFLEQVERRGEAGCSPRDMLRTRKGVDLVRWIRAGAALHAAGKVTQTWSPVGQPNTAVQESRYHAPNDLGL